MRPPLADAARTLAVALLLLVTSGCGDAPAPTTAPADPAPARAAAEASPADVVVTLLPDGDAVRVLVDDADCGVHADDATWTGVEECLAAWITADAEHAKPSVRVDAPPGVSTEQIVGSVTRIMAIGVEQVSLHRTRAAD